MPIRNLRLLALRVLLVRRMKKRICRKPRSSYIRQIFLNRNLQGETFLVRELRSDPEYHFKYFRMDKSNFDFILTKIENKITHHSTHARPISPLERLSITLRYLASGNSQISIALNYRVSPSSIGNIIRETMVAICECFSDCLPSPTQEIWEKNEKDFARRWNFPNACGSIDGKHIRIRAPASSGSNFYNYKSFFSIVLLAVANAKYMFTAVDIGSCGSESDGGILLRSTIGKCLAQNSFKLPPPKPISANGTVLPHVILGDSGFPLKTYMMTPIKGDFISKEDRIYNYRLSRARMVVENSFGILAARWRVFHTALDTDLGLAKQIVLTCVILHNYLMSKNDFNSITVDYQEDEEIIPGNWREVVDGDTGMSTLQNQGSNNYSTNSSEIRKKFKEYFLSDGRLSWQDKHVSR